jgi:hypothetical protein
MAWAPGRLQRTSPSPFEGEPTVAILDVDLGISWPGGRGALLEDVWSAPSEDALPVRR